MPRGGARDRPIRPQNAPGHASRRASSSTAGAPVELSARGADIPPDRENSAPRTGRSAAAGKRAGVP